MSSSDRDFTTMPVWHWAAPLLAAALTGAKLAGLVSADSIMVIVFAAVLLGASVFAAVEHAEVLAARIGEPFGTILLALAITVLEIGMILMVMMAASEGNDSIARDTIYSVLMVVLNGIVGICLIAGALRHFEQKFLVQGAAGILSVIATLAVIALILPNFTAEPAGPTYAPHQLVFVGVVSLALYLVFLFVQTGRHRDDYVIDDGEGPAAAKPGARMTTLSALLMIVSLASVILLAKTLTPPLEGALMGAGMPYAAVGLVIAIIILLPEGLTAIKAAKRNRLQTSLNASLGSAAASIGLTVPIVGVMSVMIGQPLTLGLDGEGMVLLLLTLGVGILTFATGRTTVLQGAVHLTIFGVFVFLTAFP